MQYGIVFVNDLGEIEVSWRNAKQMVPPCLIFTDRDTLYQSLLAVVRDEGQYKKLKSMTGDPSEIARAIEVLDIGQPLVDFDTLVDWLWRHVGWSLNNIVDWSRDPKICPYISVLYSPVLECILVIKVFKHKDDPTALK